jgi:hypothetical protein
MPRQKSRTAGIVRAVEVLLATLLGLGTMTVSPVFAGAPTFERNIAIDDTSFLPNTSAQCGFDVYLRQIGTLNLKFMVQPDGALTIQEFGGGSDGLGIYFAPSTGKSVTVNSNGGGTSVETIYPDGRDTIMSAGSDGVITVPGYGHVYIGVGLVRVTVDSNGDATEVTFGARDPDHSGICPLLA